MDHLRNGKKIEIHVIKEEEYYIAYQCTIGRQFIPANCALYVTICTVHSVGTSSNTCSFCILATDK